MARLNWLELRGFKSLHHVDLELRSLNVLIGANGAGKSNFVSFFKMVSEMMAGRLQQYIAASGRSQSLLYFGPKATTQLEATLQFDADGGNDVYRMRMFHAAGDTLAFADETIEHMRKRGRSKEVRLGTGHLETRLTERATQGESIAKVFRELLSQCRVYHFHDTSPTARIRQYGYVGDNRCLLSDGANLAAVLYRLRDEHGVVYQRIIGTIQQIAPFFEDFELEPSGRTETEITLNWRHTQSDLTFGPHQLSDGTLRAMCLITLLLQPHEELPGLIVVDEPELGLHPYALNVIASLFKAAANHTQVLISTQSSTFLDSFEPEDVIVVKREGQLSAFWRLKPDDLQSWLEDYSLGEVWEKNVIGGGPH